MGLKAKKKAGLKNLKKKAAQFSASKGDAADFLPLEGGPSRNIPKSENAENKYTVLYIGRIPHGFYETEMEAFFKQFGAVKRLRIARNRKSSSTTTSRACNLHNRLSYVHNTLFLPIPQVCLAVHSSSLLLLAGNLSGLAKCTYSAVHRRNQISLPPPSSPDFAAAAVGSSPRLQLSRCRSSRQHEITMELPYALSVCSCLHRQNLFSSS